MAAVDGTIRFRIRGGQCHSPMLLVRRITSPWYGLAGNSFYGAGVTILFMTQKKTTFSGSTRCKAGNTTLRLIHGIRLLLSVPLLDEWIPPLYGLEKS